MTVVIGFNWPVEHDHSVAVVVDGELVFASEEERWTRHKHSIDEPPINALVQALKFLKSKYGLSPSDVDAYAVNYEPRLYRRVDRAYWLRHVIINGVKYGYYDGGELGLAIDYLRSRVNLDNYLKYAYYLIRYSIRKAGFDAPINIKVIPVEHHLAHAASAYYFSGFGNAWY
ncbi:carbamoyltransferase N-terminal domain-containing protein [Vulcanisaeta sp. JCM 16159]|uniref:carbamoyltransferase N-terminal domain-containing protein n=1 Tax=Vulcanisaeta sp. JCM 16159 TaxID=1295371 RepID=UPI000A4078D2|nr:carbamoyltransferase N-terminal domain-containing protein [Vulcanisaeta sp. JCM 16159]